MLWMDDYHDNYIKPSNQEELDELIAPLILFNKGTKRWEAMYATILKCVEIFGYENISLYHTDYMRYGDHLETFLDGFWVNLREAEYNEGYMELEDCTITFEDGFMFIRC